LGYHCSTRSYRCAGNKAAVATDHSFSDHRIALQTVVIRWLEKPKVKASN